jgi:hypothetical protein
MILKVFFSWQSETDLQGLKNKEFLLMCINSVINDINAKKKIKGARLKLYEGLERIPGNAEVAKQMFEQIDQCNIFIGDFTVAQKICDRYKNLVNKHGLYFRYTPNCNVYGEYNRALGKNTSFWQQVVLIMNKVNGDPHEDAQVIPFDTRERRFPITYELTDYSKEGQEIGKKKLIPVLEDAIMKSANAALVNIGEQFSPFISWYEQHKDGRYNFTEIDDNLISQYNKTIIETKEPILIVAPESNQNTIFVHRIYEGQEETIYLYSSCEDDDSLAIRASVCKIFKNKDENSNLTLIIDRCDVELFNYILNQRKRYNAPIRVVGILKKGINISEYRIEYPHKIIDLSENIINANKGALDVAGMSTSLQQNIVGLFCQHDPMLVKRIAAQIAPEERNTVLDGSQMATKLTGAQPDSYERIILRSLSVFDYVGWKEDKKDELLFILSNREITGFDKEPSLLIAEADNVITKNIRLGYITERGRTISITSEPLVRQLSNEWLATLDADRFYEVLKILSSNDSKRLAKEFHDRFVTLNQLDGAKDVVSKLIKLLGTNGDNSFFDTDKGSLLIEAMAEIMPELVSKLLAQYIIPRSIEELKAFEMGRRNIVWTLSRLCFIPELFEDSSECLLKLALAENESWGNNATGQFKSLFPLFLPSTAASLEIRNQCLIKWNNITEYKSMVMVALARATNTSDYIYFGGAEKCGSVKRENYQPKTTEEINSYLNSCLSLLLDEIKENTQFADMATKILEDNIGSLCKAGYAKLALPVINEVATIKNRNWDKMLHHMSMFKERLFPKLTPESQLLYDDIIGRLTKDDIVSRFARVEKEVFYGSGSKFEERYRQQEEKYKSLANELYESKQVRDDIVEGLLTVECIGSSPFGQTLAKCMSEDEQKAFVELSIKIINTNLDAKPGILIDFVSEISDDLFVELIPILVTARISYIIFACFGRKSIMPSDQKFHILGELVEQGKAKAEDFHQYWCNIRTDKLTDDAVCDIFREVLSHEGGFDPVMRMSGFLGFNKGFKEYVKVAELLSKTIISSEKIRNNLVDSNQTLNIISLLLKEFDLPDLAALLNEKIIEYASDTTAYFSHSYEVEEIYKLLMDKYFYAIWPALSNALLSDDEHYMTYINLKSLLGTSMIDETQPIIMVGNHIKEIIDWCEKYPDVAPARIAGMIIVAKDDHFSDEAIMLIDKYANRPYVLDEIGCNLDSFSSVGSVVPYYERRMKIYNTMLNHKNATVREWAKKQSDACNYLMKRESIVEEEKF